MPRTVNAGRGLLQVKSPAVARARPRNAAAENYFDALNAPASDTPLLFQLIALVDAWQRCGAWDEIDAAWLTMELVTGQTTFLNLKDPDAHIATIISGSPTISAQGVQDASKATSISLGWNPTTDAAHYTKNVAEYGVYVNTNEMPASYFGGEMGTGGQAFVRVMQTDVSSNPTTAAARVNRNATFQSDTGVGSAVGLTSAVRTAGTGANINFMYRDGVSITATGRGGDANNLDNANMVLLFAQSPRRVPFAYVGGVLTDRLTFAGATRRFMGSRGAAG